MRFSWSPSRTTNSAPGIGETVSDTPTGGGQLTSDPSSRLGRILSRFALQLMGLTLDNRSAVANARPRTDHRLTSRNAALPLGPLEREPSR